MMDTRRRRGSKDFKSAVVCTTAAAAPEVPALGGPSHTCGDRPTQETVRRRASASSISNTIKTERMRTLSGGGRAPRSIPLGKCTTEQVQRSARADAGPGSPVLPGCPASHAAIAAHGEQRMQAHPRPKDTSPSTAISSAPQAILFPGTGSTPAYRFRPFRLHTPAAAPCRPLGPTFSPSRPPGCAPQGRSR